MGSEQNDFIPRDGRHLARKPAGRGRELGKRAESRPPPPPPPPPAGGRGRDCCCTGQTGHTEEGMRRAPAEALPGFGGEGAAAF